VFARRYPHHFFRHIDRDDCRAEFVREVGRLPSGVAESVLFSDRFCAKERGNNPSRIRSHQLFLVLECGAFRPLSFVGRGREKRSTRSPSDCRLRQADKRSYKIPEKAAEKRRTPKSKTKAVEKRRTPNRSGIPPEHPWFPFVGMKNPVSTGSGLRERNRHFRSKYPLLCRSRESTAPAAGGGVCEMNEMKRGPPATNERDSTTMAAWLRRGFGILSHLKPCQPWGSVTLGLLGPGSKPGNSGLPGFTSRRATLALGTLGSLRSRFFAAREDFSHAALLTSWSGFALRHASTA